MPIDTAAKRSSCLDFEEVWTAGIPFPDSIVDQGDRQHLLWSYSGIIVAGGIFPGMIAISDTEIMVVGISDTEIMAVGISDEQIGNVIITDDDNG